jgi:hypothetical protein
MAERLGRQGSISIFLKNNGSKKGQGKGVR